MPGERREAAEGPEAGDPRGQDGPGPADAERTDREEPAPAGEASPASGEEDRRSRPDIRAARTETRLRRWALLLLVLVPVVYFLYQRFS